MTYHKLRSPVLIGLVAVGIGLSISNLAVASADDTSGCADRGFSLGIRYQTSMIGAEDPPPSGDPQGLYFEEVGHGATFVLGYTFTSSFALDLALSFARHGTTQEAVEALLSSIAFEAHYRFLPAERARPYLFGGLGGSAMRVDSEGYSNEMNGGVAVLGAGVFYCLTNHLILDFSGRLDLINWDEVKVTVAVPDGGTLELAQPVDESGSAGKFQFGFRWQF